MKKHILTLFVSGLLVAVLPLFAAADTGAHSTSVEEMITSILSSQNVSRVSDVRCDELTDTQLEELGDAVMGVLHPNEQEHELMDTMMGGGGSSQLRAMHQIMALQYLGCAANTISGFPMMGGMMSGGMMNNNFTGGNMMGGYFSDQWSGGRPMMNVGYGLFSFGLLGMILWTLGWIAVITVAVLLIRRLFWRTQRNMDNSAVNILKERYAKSEIDKKEFEEKLQDIQDSHEK